MNDSHDRTGPVILPYCNSLPRIADDAFIAPGAVVIGNVEVGPETGIWFNCVVRGDVMSIRIGAGTNIQDGTIVHVSTDEFATEIGDHVTVGHNAIIHGCRLDDASFVGMGAVVMDGAVVESGAMVAAGALVTPGKRVPSGQLWAGSPAKLLRDLTPEESAFIGESARHYAELAAVYRGRDSKDT